MTAKYSVIIILSFIMHRVWLWDVSHGGHSFATHLKIVHHKVKSMGGPIIKWVAGIWLNSLWPNDAIWQQRSGSKLAQVMACCLTAPSHYLNQCGLPSVRSIGIYLSTILQEILQLSITKISWKITFLFFFKSPRGQWVKYSELGY